MKRFFDLVFALVIFPLILIYILSVSIITIIFYRFSPFYKQERIGKDGKRLICYKIQAMRPPQSEAEVNDKKLDQLRLTQFGRWLRIHGLDEIPQIANIILGQMSFIGPRPLLEKNIRQIEDENQEYSNLIKKWEVERSKVRPGLSGWHQIHSLGPRIVKYDLEYLSRPMVGKQIKIFFASVIILLIGKKLYFKQDPNKVGPASM